jgi:hypothetical protein
MMMMIRLLRIRLPRTDHRTLLLHKFTPGPSLRPRSRLLQTTPVMSTFYDLKAPQTSTKTFDFETLRGKVVLIVNVASQWYVLDPMTP